MKGEPDFLWALGGTVSSEFRCQVSTWKGSEAKSEVQMVTCLGAEKNGEHESTRQRFVQQATEHRQSISLCYTKSHTIISRTDSKMIESTAPLVLFKPGVTYHHHTGTTLSPGSADASVRTEPSPQVS